MPYSTLNGVGATNHNTLSPWHAQDTIVCFNWESCTDLDAFNDPQEYQRSEEYYQKWHEARILYGELGRGTQQSMKKINHTAKYTIKPKLTHSVAYQRGFGLSAEMKESHHAAVLDSQQRSAAFQSV